MYVHIYPHIYKYFSEIYYLHLEQKINVNRFRMQNEGTSNERKTPRELSLLKHECD